MLQRIFSLLPVPKSQITFFIGLINSLIFALIDSFIIHPFCRPLFRHLYNALAGLYLIYFAYGKTGLFSLLIPALSVYATKGIFRRNKNIVIFGWIGIFAYLAYNHFARTSYSFRDYQVYHTASLMVLVARLTMFISDLGDGKVSNQCNIFKYLAFCFYYPSVLGGPCLRLNEYLNCYDKKINFERFHTTRAAFQKAKLVSGFKRILQSLLCAVIYVAGSYYFKPALLFNDKFVAMPLLLKFLVIYCIAVVSRSKYYLAWGFAEGCCIISGTAFSGYDSKLGKFQWETARLIKIMSVELASSPRDLLANWHIQTAKWLYDYVYIPSARGKKPGFRSTFFTNLTSAFWHGFRWGYYVTFVSTAFTIVVWRILRRKLIAPLSRLNPMFCRVIGIVLTQFLGSSLLMPFVLLGWNESVFYLKQIYCIPQIFVTVLFVIGLILPVFK